MDTELKKLTVPQLLQLHSATLKELRIRKVIRTSNNPCGDYAETLFCRALGWEMSGNSNSGYDATDISGVRYQIKCRRLNHDGKWRPLSTIRNLDKNPFDKLAALYLDDDFLVIRAAVIPIEMVKATATFIQHVNGWRFLLKDTTWSEVGVLDVTKVLKEFQKDFLG